MGYIRRVTRLHPVFFVLAFGCFLVGTASINLWEAFEFGYWDWLDSNALYALIWGVCTILSSIFSAYFTAKYAAKFKTEKEDS